MKEKTDKSKKKVNKNDRICKACGFVSSPSGLGAHYKKNPKHRPSKDSKHTIRPPKNPEAGPFESGWEGGPGRPRGSRSQSVKDREMVEHFLNVIRLRAGDAVDDSIATGIYAWAQEDKKNMTLFMERVMILLGERLTPAQMSSDEKELRLLELEARLKETEQRPAGGQVINFIAPNLPIPNVIFGGTEKKKIESKILSDTGIIEQEETSENGNLEDWDDFPAEGDK